jgi:hypothetical protein
MTVDGIRILYRHLLHFSPTTVFFFWYAKSYGSTERAKNKDAYTYTHPYLLKGLVSPYEKNSVHPPLIAKTPCTSW